MRHPNAIQWAGCVLSLAGAALTACADPRPRFYGFVLYLVANLALLWWAHATRNRGILTMQVGFTLITVAGLVNHWAFR